MSRLLAAIAALLLFATPALAADSLAKVRADYGPRITALEAKIKALEDAQAKAAAVPAAATPAAGPVAPVGVVAKSVQAVWALQLRPPPVTTKVFLAEAAANHILPAGWSYDFVGKVLYITADSDETGWDLRGVRIYNQAGRVLKLRSCAIGAIDTLDYIVRNGDDNGTVASGLELYGCRIYGKNTKGLLSSWSAVNSTAKSYVRAYDTDWVDADYRFLSAYNVDIARNWFGRVGVQTSPGAHIEQLFLWNDATIRDSLVDATGSTAPGASGNIMAIAGKQTLSGNVFRGAAAINAYVALQGGPGVTWAMNDNAIEPGLSAANSPTGGYIAKNGGGAIPLGNVALATGASIDAAIAQAQ